MVAGLKAGLIISGIYAGVVGITYGVSALIEKVETEKLRKQFDEEWRRAKEVYMFGKDVEIIETKYKVVAEY